MRGSDYDVAVVGASTAGCTAARLLGLAGARVALLERKPDPEAYKTVCTHYIQPSATPTIVRLGLAPMIEARGAVRNSVDVWTPYGGWINSPKDVPHGYNITRRKLDPILRRLAADTPGVDYLPGQAVVGVLGNGRPTGVELEDHARSRRRRFRARLVVAADGRGSTVARLARVPGRVRPHNRFFYWAYWTGVRPATSRSRMWFTEPDCAYSFPNEDGLTLLLAGPSSERLPEFRADLEGAFMRYVDALPDGPDLSGATRESKLLGKLKLPNVSRPAARPGLAFVGDAALASDPLWGVGCGWAFQSAEWLADEVAPALHGGDLDAALERYRQLHRRRLGLHHFLIADLATTRPANPFERALYRASARDETVLRAFEGVGSRRRSPVTMLDPRVLVRLSLVALAGRRS
jgi:flavin-dependent dehydrogenase